MAEYTIDITLSDDTLAAFLKGGWQLQGYKGVKGGGGGLPTLWFSVTEFSSDLHLKWYEQYGAYVDKHVDASVVGLDETIALRDVETPYGSN